MTEKMAFTLRSLLLAALICMMLMIVVPERAMAAVVASGNCGRTSSDKVTWTLDDTGLMVVSGTGRIQESWIDRYTSGETLRKKIKKLIIEPGITEIGNYAFSDLPYLTSAEIRGNDLHTIGYNCFSSDARLKTVRIPGSVKNAIDVFSGCDALETVYFSGSGDQWDDLCAENFELDYAKVIFVGPKITKQPKNVSVTVGQRAEISIEAGSNEGAVTYTWYFKDPGSTRFLKAAETSNTYGFTMTDARSGRQMYCVVTDVNGYTVTSQTVTLRVPQALKIVTQPVDITAGMNTKNTFSLTAQGEGLTYQWYYQNEKGRYEHASTNPLRPTYTTTFLAKRNNRKLYCIVTDRFGNTVKSNTVQIHVDPLITKQPETAYAPSGRLMKYTIAAQGEGLTYRWFYRNKGRWSWTQSTQTGSTYTTRALYDGREIYCLVTNAAGITSKSDVATMYVGVPTVVTKQPTDITVKEGRQAKFTVAATGNGLHYSWYYRSVGRPFLTRSYQFDPVYTTKGTLDRDGREIYCVITDSHGIETVTETVTLHVIPAGTE